MARKFQFVMVAESCAREAYCVVCCKRFKLDTMGIKAVESHMQSCKHDAFATARQNRPQIFDFCAATA